MRLLQNWNGFCNGPTHFNTSKPDGMVQAQVGQKLVIYHILQVLGVVRVQYIQGDLH